jgi:hypothetical protein
MSRSPRFAPNTAPRSRLVLVGALLLSVFLLTGCFTVQLKAQVNSDGTVSGTSRFGVSKSMAALAGGQAALLTQLKSGEPCKIGNAKTTSKDFDDGTYVGVECTFSHISLADFNSGSSSDGAAALRLEHVGATYRLSGSFNLAEAASSNALGGGSGSGTGGTSGGLIPPSATAGAPSGLPTDLNSLLPSGFPSDLNSLLPSGFPSDLNSLLPSGFPSDLNSLLPSGFPSDLNSLLPSGFPSSQSDPSAATSSLLKSAKISFQFSFPGKVTSSAGKVDGNSVTFTPDAAGKINFATVADGTSSTAAGGRTLWIIALAAVLLLAVLIVFLIRRRRRAARRAAQHSGQPGMQGGPAQPLLVPGGQSLPGFGPDYQQYPQTQYPQTQYPQQPQYPPAQYPQQPQYPPAQYPQQPQYPQTQYPQQPQYPQTQYPQQPQYPQTQYPQQPPYPPAQYPPTQYPPAPDGAQNPGPQNPGPPQ